MFKSLSKAILVLLSLSDVVVAVETGEDLTEALETVCIRTCKAKMVSKNFKTVDEDHAFYKKCLVDDCHVGADAVRVDDQTCVFMCHASTLNLGYTGDAY